MRNNLEAYSYEMRSNIDAYGSLEKYVDSATRDAFLKDLNQTVEWLYEPNGGEIATKSELWLRLNNFRKIGEPIKKRQDYYSEVDVYLT